ncbi:inhibitor of apoptosis repeat-containing protein [Zopfia rhizophila CBS 207.26]|uniref:Inhibitor of apoptosis repeat-containing protein n=1 Tax=Zopfia rhizophila CBS 207.26 TaxID=1314779 RepID=A0A6A6EUP5_9PEZI|nr:inhibitor of apoptosis repeat-containing protein [Zopfia rhizophila CBS 207.26]
MKPSLAVYQARLDSFLARPKTRRASNRSKKPALPAAWPLPSPTPAELACAGFVWKPTTESPDNVICFCCNRQLDGWEASDNPAHEHLTHSPSCGFAITKCIQLRNGDPQRVEEDPLSQTMQNARRETFGDFWPLDSQAGFPSVDQMVDAGWCYDPSPEHHDGVTCPYCSLSLDEWDAGDNPLEEHRRRAQDCLFFSLKELYHPANIPFTTASINRAKAAARTSGKRASTTKKAPAKAPAKSRTTRAATKEPVEVAPVKAQVKATKRQAPKRGSVASTVSTLSTTRQTRGTKRSSEDVDHPPLNKKTRGTKRASEDVDHQPLNNKKTRGTKRTSEALDHQPEYTKPTRGTKRTSEDLEQQPECATETRENKRAKQISDALERGEWPSISSIRPESVFASTPSPPVTPSEITPINRRAPAANWEPINIDSIVNQKGDLVGLISDIMVDAGLDKGNLDVDMNNADAVLEAVKLGLTEEEKNMTVEQWVMYNAKRGEEKLRAECERLMAAFDAEAKKALVALDAIPVIDN